MSNVLQEEHDQLTELFKDKSNFNNKYYITNESSSLNSLFSSFKIFSKRRYNSSSRSTYPPLISNPSFKDIVFNINKSDIVMYISFMGCSLLFSLYMTRNFVQMSHKLYYNKHIMSFLNLVILYVIHQTSYARLIGNLDNGLRWRKDNYMIKYDLTSEYEKQHPFISILRQNKI